MVKGKGEMLTFYVLGRKISRSWRFGRTVSLQGNNSLAEVVYGMVRARKRRKTTRGKTERLKQTTKKSYRPRALIWPKLNGPIPACLKHSQIKLKVVVHGNNK